MLQFQDERTRPGEPVTLPSGALREGDDIDLLEIICGNVFDPVRCLIAYRKLSDVDWAWVEPLQRWYSYQFSSWEVYEVPEWRVL